MKPREWWTDGKIIYDNEEIAKEVITDSLIVNVIEKSTYDELLKQTIALSKAIWDADEYIYEHSIQGTGNLDNILRDAGFKWLGFCAVKGIKDSND